MIMEVRNVSGSDVVIADLGKYTIATGATANLVEDFPLHKIASSTDLIASVLAGDLIVNDGEKDLSANDGAVYLALHPVTIGPKDPSGKMRVHQTSRPTGTQTMWCGTGDDPTDVNDVGGGEEYIFEHEAGDPTTQSKIVDLNTIANPTYLHEALLTWKGCDMDRVTAGMVPVVVTGNTGQTGTNYNVDPDTGMVVPAAGDGTFELTSDLTQPDGGLVQMVEHSDSGSKPPAFWNADFNTTTGLFENITAAPLGDGEFNLFTVEIYLLKFFVNVPLLGDGFQIFNSSDTDPVGHGLRMKVEWKTNAATIPGPGDHKWQFAAVLIMHREKTT